MNVMMIVAVKLCLLAHNYTESLLALFALDQTQRQTPDSDVCLLSILTAGCVNFLVQK